MVSATGGGILEFILRFSILRHEITRLQPDLGSLLGARETLGIVSITEHCVFKAQIVSGMNYDVVVVPQNMYVIIYFVLNISDTSCMMTTSGRQVEYLSVIIGKHSFQLRPI